ncbi:MAG: site-2 protease family protein [Victivallaceae bacterium]|nr:site-2 protease family protein [Victivallaceae bacterium]
MWSSIGGFLLNVAAVVFVFVALGFCIISHEFGHFLAAKWRGLRVDAFAFGFRPFWRKKYGGVEYRIGWLPFGGYCEIPQIDATDDVPRAADGTELPRARALDRILVAFAGPLFNILGGLLVGIAVWALGMPQSSPEMREMTVRAIDPTGPEYAAGLRVGDRIVELNGKKFRLTWENFFREVVFSVGNVTLGVERDGRRFGISYVPRADPLMENAGTPSFLVWIPLELHPEKGSIAERAGVRSGDLLAAVDGKDVFGFAEYQMALDRSAGKAVALDLYRDGQPVSVTLVPEKISGAGRAYALLSIRKTDDGVFVVSVDPDGPAARAGIPSGAKLVSAGNRTISETGDLSQILRDTGADGVEIVWSVDGDIRHATLHPEILYPHSIGAEILSIDHPTPWHQLVSALDMSWKSLRGIAVGIGHRLGWTEKQSSLKVEHMSGPLGIGMVLYESVRHSSFGYALYFIVAISFALAIFNLLPLPVLDGGHILFGVLEIVLRRSLPSSVVKTLSLVFVILLVALMIFVTVSDGKRFYRRYIPVEKTR